MIYLDDKNLDIVKNILNKTVPDANVVIFGSRAIGNIKPHSDIDLCIMGNETLSLLQIAELKEAFSNSDLPVRVDIVEWATITPEFQQVIEKCSVPIQQKRTYR